MGIREIPCDTLEQAVQSGVVCDSFRPCARGLTPFSAHQHRTAGVSSRHVTISRLLQVPPEGCITLERRGVTGSGGGGGGGVRAVGERCDS